MNQFSTNKTTPKLPDDRSSAQAHLERLAQMPAELAADQSKLRSLTREILEISLPQYHGQHTSSLLICCAVVRATLHGMAMDQLHFTDSLDLIEKRVARSAQKGFAVSIPSHLLDSLIQASDFLPAASSQGGKSPAVHKLKNLLRLAQLQVPWSSSQLETIGLACIDFAKHTALNLPLRDQQEFAAKLLALNRSLLERSTEPVLAKTLLSQSCEFFFNSMCSKDNQGSPDFHSSLARDLYTLFSVHVAHAVTYPKNHSIPDLFKYISDALRIPAMVPSVLQSSAQELFTAIAPLTPQLFEEGRSSGCAYDYSQCVFKIVAVHCADLLAAGKHEEAAAILGAQEQLAKEHRFCVAGLYLTIGKSMQHRGLNELAQDMSILSIQRSLRFGLEEKPHQHMCSHARLLATTCKLLKSLPGEKTYRALRHLVLAEKYLSALDTAQVAETDRSVISEFAADILVIAKIYAHSLRFDEHDNNSQLQKEAVDRWMADRKAGLPRQLDTL